MKFQIFHISTLSFTVAFFGTRLLSSWAKSSKYHNVSDHIMRYSFSHSIIHLIVLHLQLKPISYRVHHSCGLQTSWKWIIWVLTFVHSYIINFWVYLSRLNKPKPSFCTSPLCLCQHIYMTLFRPAYWSSCAVYTWLADSTGTNLRLSQKCLNTIVIEWVSDFPITFSWIARQYAQVKNQSFFSFYLLIYS